MAISAVRIDERVAGVEVTDAELIVRLRDGRRLAAPLDWFPRLKAATPALRSAEAPRSLNPSGTWP